MRSLTGLGVAAAVIVLSAAPALGHTELLGSSPEAGASLPRPPATVALQFSQPVLDLGATVQITGPAGKVSQGAAKPAGAAVLQEVAPEQPAGKYRVVWRVTAQDGHPIEGSFTFTARAGAAPTGQASQSPAAAPPSPGQPPTPTSAPNPTPTSAPRTSAASSASQEGASPGRWQIVGVTVVGAGLLAALVASRLPRPGRPAPARPSD